MASPLNPNREGRVSFVTGSTRDIGLPAARVPAQAGSVVILNGAHDEEGLNNLAAQMASEHNVECILRDALLGMASQELIDSVFSVNVLGAIYHLQEASRLMSCSRSGSIVNVSSIIGRAEDVANAILFFASSLSEYVTGQVLGVDGAMLI